MTDHQLHEVGPTRLVGRSDSEWPRGLSEAGFAAPDCLYVRGLPIPDMDQTIAVVGSRRPTGSGVMAARQIARALAQAKYVVVSGLAQGVDAVAHRAALDAGGTTVAVLGAGLDNAYPVRNKRLREEIERRGTLVTEYPEGTQPLPRHFPARNRIIAGLSKAVVFVEGTDRSGALSTARFAFEANREVFAVPGSIRNANAFGPNELIRTSVATMITDVQHIFDQLAPGLVWSEHVGVQRVNGKPALRDDEFAILQAFDDVPLSTAAIARSCPLQDGQVKLALARLEVRGLVVRRRRGWEMTETGARVRATRPPGAGEAEAAVEDLDTNGSAATHLPVAGVANGSQASLLSDW